MLMSGVFVFMCKAVAVSAASPVVATAPAYACVIDSSSGFSGPLLDNCKRFPEDKRSGAVRNILDSMGFFKASFDTQARVIHVHPGPRARVDSLIISSEFPCAADSIGKGLFPRYYDAGDIQGLARKVLYFFSCHGRPFATLSITIVDTQRIDMGRNRPYGRLMFVIFNVRENGRYAFAKPMLLGKFKTDPRLIGHDIEIVQGAEFDERNVDESRERLLTRPYIATVETGALKIMRDTLARKDTMSGAGGFSGGVIAPFSIEDHVGLGLDGAIAFQAGQTAANTLSGIFNISLNNIFHYGEAGLFSYKGEQNYQRLEVSLSVPYLLGLSLFGAGGFGLEVQQNAYGYLHGELEVLTEWWPYWQWGMELQAHEITRTLDSTSAVVNDIASNYEGVDFVVTRRRKPFRAGQFASDLDFRIGSGLQQTQGEQLNRWHIDINTGLQIPLSLRYAVSARAVAGTFITDIRDTLQTVELYRTGGYNSLRGYTDNEFAFKTVLYEQLEYLYYFNYNGAVFVFLDGGIGFNENVPIRVPSGTKMLGYGVGMRIPVKIGDAAIEWARNYTDTQSWGRIHIAVSNNVASGQAK
jgi:hypothetical protein